MLTNGESGRTICPKVAIWETTLCPGIVASHELPERSRKFRRTAARSSFASGADEVELGVSVAGCVGPEATLNSAFDEQESLNFSRASVGSPCFRHGCAFPGRDVVRGPQVENAVRRIEEYVGRFGTKLPIAMIFTERFALDQTTAVEAREHVVERAIRRIRRLRPQGGTFDKLPDRSKAHEVVAPDAFVLTSAEEDDKVALFDRVSDIPAAHAPARLGFRFPTEAYRLPPKMH